MGRNIVVGKPNPVRARLFRVAAVLLSSGLLLLFDVLLGISGLTPPENSQIFYDRTFEEAFTPFVDSGEGELAIRSDWVNQGVNLRATQGPETGWFFLYPGFRPGRLSNPKNNGTIRIIVLGGSSAYGLYVGEEGAFTGRLRTALSARHPDKVFEILNLGCAGWASDRVLNLMKGLVAMEPDLLIVYSGHNELLAPVSRADLDAETKPPGIHTRLLTLSNLYAWIDHLVGYLRIAGRFDQVDEQTALHSAGQSLVFDPSTIPVASRTRPSQDLLDRAAEKYRSNLQAMIDLSGEHSIPLLLGRPTPNLWTPPTIASGDVLTRSGSPERALFVKALEDIESSRPFDALPDLQILADENKHDASTHYWLGVALIRTGHMENGLLELQTALDNNVRTHRITGPLGKAFDFLVPTPISHVVDFGPVLLPSGAEAEAVTHFADHCHPTAEGHAGIANCLLPYVEKILGLELTPPFSG